MNKTTAHRKFLPVLVYTALTSSIVSSLGMLLVPTISDELGVEVSTGQWMLTINLLVGAVATPIMGRLSDGPHRKRLLLTSLTVIFFGSVVAATATNFGVFLIGRGLQGLSYGIVPVTITLARRYLTETKARQGISSLSVTVATGLGVGYPLTGILAATFDFRLAFWFAALFLATTVVAVWFMVPNGPDDRAPRVPFDYVGAALIGSGLALLLTAVSEGSRWGWGSTPTIGFFAAAFLAMSLWAVVELHSRNPLIDLRVLRNSDVLVANSTAIGLGAAMYIGLSIGSLVAQSPTSTGYGIALPLFWAGFVMLPLSAGSFGANRLVRRISHRIPIRTLLLTGAGLVTGSSVLLWLAHDALWEIMIGMFGFGTGIGMTYAAMPALIARQVADAQLGSAVSFNQVLRTVGGSFGSALSGAVLAAHLASDSRPSGAGINLAFAIGAIGCCIVFVALLANRIASVTRKKRADHVASRLDSSAGAS
ncbi:MFS transporter [Rhodococcus sp. 06-156-3C]|uniref:MFS transporter n=1 Tax=Nocardiaceae TaxID=85025 RepID=UPI000522FDDF|nr:MULTISPECIES: MFS transporter [Rhodococcus]OZD13053.1 MFS transporter [Rhodococcus sp. 06-156-4a]OZD17922.1 MFS transporter [Rhodococcus sp. 06-156-3C]OZD20646.1 MFS transporter [Rhodococcus sp. 06-156-4C]OZD30636.1 MFS transporter [Rhodococcus sp. 06-156-3b]OZD32592.1 MFS transporter [Rhodococcus sp. 06-156-3]